MIGFNIERPYLESREKLSPAYKERRFQDLKGPRPREEAVLYIGYNGLFAQAYRVIRGIYDGLSDTVLPEIHAVTAVPHDCELAVEHARVVASALEIKCISRAMARMYPHNLMIATPVITDETCSEILDLIGYRTDAREMGMTSPDKTVVYATVMNREIAKRTRIDQLADCIAWVYVRSRTYRIECIWEQEH